MNGSSEYLYVRMIRKTFEENDVSIGRSLIPETNTAGLVLNSYAYSGLHVSSILYIID